MFMSLISSFSLLESLSLSYLLTAANTDSIIAVTSLLDNAMLHLNFLRVIWFTFSSCLHY